MPNSKSKCRWARSWSRRRYVRSSKKRVPRCTSTRSAASKVVERGVCEPLKERVLCDRSEATSKIKHHCRGECGLLVKQVGSRSLAPGQLFSRKEMPLCSIARPLRERACSSRENAAVRRSSYGLGVLAPLRRRVLARLCDRDRTVDVLASNDAHRSIQSSSRRSSNSGTAGRPPTSIQVSSLDGGCSCSSRTASDCSKAGSRARAAARVPLPGASRRRRCAPSESRSRRTHNTVDKITID
jgi:hypothetical protein